MSDSRLEGGKRALLGFYYQMIVTLGIGALITDYATANEDFSTIDISADATRITDPSTFLLPEPSGLGEDLLVSGKLKMLCQMKYSSNSKVNTFGLDDFRKVLYSFALSQHNAKKNIVKIDCFVLITNRSPSTPVEDVITYAKEYGSNPTGSVFYKGSTKHLKDQLNDWLANFSKSTEPSINDIVSAAAYVFPRLIFRMESQLEEWHENFYSFACRHGAKDAEIRDAEHTLLGSLMSHSASPVTIDREQLVKAITGTREALELTPRGIGKNCAKDWYKRTEQDKTDESWMIYRRIEGLEETIKTKKIVFITGDGGNGKSVLLAQLTKPMIQKVDDPSTFDGFVIMELCMRVRDELLQKKVGAWAERGQSGTLSEPLKRLRIANPSARKLLWVCLDGLDEKFPHDDHLSELVDEARRSDDLCIIFSCRKENNLNRVVRRIYPSKFTR